MRLIVLVFLSCFMHGCAAQSADVLYKQKQTKYVTDIEKKERTPYQRQAAFTPEDYATYRTKGTGTLSGEAFVRTRSGDVSYAVGQDVWLIPATAYGKEFMEQDLVKAQSDTIPPLDRRIYDAIRTDQADGHGRFSFTELPTGEYFIVTTIFWEVPKYTKYGSSSSSIGGAVWQPVTVRDGEQKNIILTR